MKRHGKHVRVYTDELDVSGFARAGKLGLKVDTAEVTNLLSAGNKEYLEGVYDADGSYVAFFDDADDGYDEKMWTKVTTQGDDHYQLDVIGLGATIPAAGDVAYERIIRFTGQPREYDIGGAIMLSQEYQVTGGVGRGAVLWSGAITATGTKPGVNVGLTTTPKMVRATYRILAVSGSGSITVAIEESQNDGSPDTYAAIAALNSGAMTGVGVVQKQTTGSTEAWKRINVTAFSGFTSVTLLVTLAHVA